MQSYLCHACGKNLENENGTVYAFSAINHKHFALFCSQDCELEFKQ